MPEQDGPAIRKWFPLGGGEVISLAGYRSELLAGTHGDE